MVGNWVDYFIIGAIGLSAVTGLFRGFVKELIALCVWVVAIWLSFRYSPQVELWLQPYLHEKSIRTVAAVIAIFLTALIAGGLFNALLSFILNRSGLSGTDRILGMGFGVVRGVFIVALIALVIKMTSIPFETYTRQSLLYAKFDPVVNWISQFVPEFIKQVKVFDGDDKEIIDITPAP
ncbi:CvpA family protein [Legionella septentrionalis]|uniref:CvpA family protein n=1 Tax=Legionella septentrionalis TaxID=2498109 RepID=A0A3S0X002_9GAMM|nr:CvpA family protein [Legionella septentrionalis]RUQ85199.1 CvpA family protein [Legionella septentrionalis]RUQ97979.1 CvpA family protein [Legionella septentrionalis]